MDTQTTSSHPESGDVVVCNEEATAVESPEGKNCSINQPLENNNMN